MRRTILIVALLATGACGRPSPVDDSVAPHSNFVYMPDVVDEPDVVQMNAALKSPVGPSRQANFADQNPDEDRCGAPDKIEAWLTEHMYSKADEQPDDGYDVWLTGYGGVLHVRTSPMEYCLPAEEPTDHRHDEETGARL